MKTARARVVKTSRPTVEHVMEEIRRSEHRIALLMKTIAYLDLFLCFNGQAPERLVIIDRESVAVDKDVLLELQAELQKAIKAERARLDRMRRMKASASIPEKTRLVIGGSRTVLPFRSPFGGGQGLG